MNFIHTILLIGLIILTVERGYIYFKIKSAEEGQKPSSEYKKARNEFLWSIVLFVVYAYVKLT